MDREEITFSFGENWQNFIADNFDREKLAEAKKHLLDFLGLPDLKNLTFLDIGCGSGLFSLAAYSAGAAKIISFDLDPLAVAATKFLWSKHGSPKHWEIFQGSILDQDLVGRLTANERADIVYSWGVLHHTGKMWTAIDNACKLVRPGGLFYLALYTTGPKSGYWLKIKKRYNLAGPYGKKLIEAKHILRHDVIPHLLKLQNPLKDILKKRPRGMSYYTDVRDWLGGYPYEDAKIEEVLNIFLNKLDWEYLNLATGEANTEYLFRRPL